MVESSIHSTIMVSDLELVGLADSMEVTVMEVDSSEGVLETILGEVMVNIILEQEFLKLNLLRTVLALSVNKATFLVIQEEEEVL